MLAVSTDQVSATIALARSSSKYRKGLIILLNELNLQFIIHRTVEARVSCDYRLITARDLPANVKTFFVSSQRKPLHRSTVNLLLGKYSTAASLPLHARPHMLRHGCGFALAD